MLSFCFLFFSYCTSGLKISVKEHLAAEGDWDVECSAIDPFSGGYCDSVTSNGYGILERDLAASAYTDVSAANALASTGIPSAVYQCRQWCEKVSQLNQVNGPSANCCHLDYFGTANSKFGNLPFPPKNQAESQACILSQAGSMKKGGQANQQWGMTCTACGAAATSTCGDPQVRNMRGEKFDILALGDFSFVHLAELDMAGIPGASLLNIQGSIDTTRNTNHRTDNGRTGSGSWEVNGRNTLAQCAETYIQNVTLTGRWMQNINANPLQIRAASADAQNSSLLSLEVRAGTSSNWEKAEMLKRDGTTTSSSTIILHLHDVVVKVMIDQHWEWTFLNLMVKGVAKAKDVKISGLMTYDDPEAAKTPPPGCRVRFSQGLVSKPFHSKITVV